jgi:hypothetical protein
MGLLDKVKAQATQLAEKGQEAAKAGQAKIGTLQTKKQADTLLRDLGAHTFAKMKGRGDAQTDTKIAGVTAQLDAHEAEHGPIDLTPDPAVTATTDAAGGQAPPVANVPQSSVVGVDASDVGGAPAPNFTAASNVGVPASSVGGIPSGNVGGIPSGNVGGIPSGNVGGVPEASMGDTPS